MSGIVTDIKFDDKKTLIYLKAKENILVYYYDNIELKLGDKIEIIGVIEDIKPNTNFNLFNYKKYLLSKKIYYKMTAQKIRILNNNKNILYELKSFIIDRIGDNAYLQAFVLGDTSNLDDRVKSSYRINGISHLFSVSGMHIGLLSGIILYVLNKIKKKNINYIMVILFLIIYMFLTNFSPSVIRTTSLFVLITINKLLNAKLTTLKILVFICCIVLIINPYNVYNIGFLFSYTISFYLILFSEIINRNKRYIKKLLVTSLISFLVSIPILINNYFSINLMSILNNLIFVPFVSLIVFPFSLIVLLIPKLIHIYEILISILENISLFIENFKIEIILCHTNIIIIVFYYLLITFILYKIYKKKYNYIILIIVVLFIHTNINYIRNNLYITFLDVGQGDSALIHLPYNKGDILIDTGGNYNYDLSIDLINYLKSEGIKKIDYLVLTHGDYDHIGASISLVNSFKVNKVILNNDKFNDLELELIKILVKKNISYYQNIKELNVYNNQLHFLNDNLYDNENDNSNVIYTELNGVKLLLMGDAGIEVEEYLLDKYNLKNIDVLKVGHHGSNTSSNKKFIDSINPKYSIISVGENNRYGHPKEPVLEILNKSKIYRTDIDGSIMFKIKNNELNIQTCGA